MSEAVIDLAGVQRLLELLAGAGYRVLGPSLRDDAIVYDDVGGVADMPAGWTDRQEPEPQATRFAFIGVIVAIPASLGSIFRVASP